MVETEEFMEMGFFRKSLFFTLWSKIILAKYISMWLLAEGTVIISGNVIESITFVLIKNLSNLILNVQVHWTFF